MRFPDYRNKQIVEELDKRFGYGKYSIRASNDGVESLLRAKTDEFIKMNAGFKLIRGQDALTITLKYDRGI